MQTRSNYMMNFQRSSSSILVLLTSLLLCISGNSYASSLNKHYASKKGSYPLVTRHLNDNQEPQFINRLIMQDSLYLLQHAHNPVDWWPWGDGAIAAAKKQNKPILLSIGYSTCHWCHVMARESFEDIEIANYINEHFIPIKVDREENPDIDELYLTAVQMLSGQAGWPLTAVLTPKGQPFFGGTYFAPNRFQQLLSKINTTWTDRRSAVIAQAERLETALKNISKSNLEAKSIDQTVINNAVAQITQSFRSYQAGPGFPREPEILFLLNNALTTLSNDTITTIQQRLKKLAASGLHDQVGGGFHRYTVAADLKIPHFEKMLYNQAQMGQSYFRAYVLSSDKTLKEIGEKTFAFLLTEMQSPEGGFYAAMDAESEHDDGKKSEGAYYIWSYDELSNLLSSKELALAESALGVSQQGNFNSSNVLQNASINSNDSPDKTLKLNKLLGKLNTVRQKRKKPSTDTKIITAWNSMAVSALITGYKTVGNNEYRQAAINAAERIWKNAYSKSSGLARTIPSSKQRVAGTLEDYAYFANALLDLYDLENDQRWLTRAQELSQQMNDRFRDGNSRDDRKGGFLISSAKQQKNLIVALVTARDDAINSGNSIAAQLFARLYRRTGNVEYRQVARDVLSTFSKQIQANPESLSGMLVAANLLNLNEIDSTQYAAKGKVKVQTKTVNQQLSVNIEIEPGWHINAHKVLEDALIPTKLTALNSQCASIGEVNYPEGKIVSLGFQDDELSVYENTVQLSSRIKDTPSNCHLLAAELQIQACSDEVCQSPETLQIRSLSSN